MVHAYGSSSAPLGTSDHSTSAERSSPRTDRFYLLATGPSRNLCICEEQMGELSSWSWKSK